MSASTKSDEAPSCDDMVNMTVLDEPSILSNLKLRFAQDHIYTNVGPILISINPYKTISSMYAAERSKSYQSGTNTQPHVYGIAAQAYKSMMANERNQSILISGESGAGKTESCKFVLNYLAEVSGQGSKLQHQIMESNPLMEAFGNSKTVRNNNSSRFGKFIQINFSRSGKIEGAEITKYLLERSRVVQQSEKERNFHIFYQVCSSTDLRKMFQLQQPSEYNYLRTTTRIDGVDDALEFSRTVKAMKAIGIEAQQRKEVFQILAAILMIGNIGFSAAPSDSESVVLTNETELTAAAKLLGVKPEVLKSTLCFKEINVGGQIFRKPQTVVQAQDSRDALAKTLYDRLFDWLIERINMAIRTTKEFQANVWRHIGVLDVFGFEYFEKNSFEQLCINYCNEKLQQLYNSHVFDQEQKIYAAEGISFADVAFVDNQACVDFFEKGLGILSLLNEECKFPQSTDKSFLEKLAQHHKGDSEVFQKDLRSVNKFTVKHFAGEVTYTADGFLDKNRDTLRPEISKVLAHSNIAFVRSLFEAADDSAAAGAETSAARPETPRSGGGQQNSLAEHFLSPKAGTRAAAPRALSPVPDRLEPASEATKSRPKSWSPNDVAGFDASKGSVIMKSSIPTTATVSDQFKKQLLDLVWTLSQTDLLFVRCIKPNNAKSPDVFDDPLVLAQLRCTGVQGTIKIRQAGFPIRFTFTDFLDRYSHSYGKKDIPGNNPKTKVVNLATFLKLEWAKWQVGKNQIFFKLANAFDALEKIRQKRFHDAASKIQAAYRCKKLRRKYLNIKKAALCLQTVMRGIPPQKRLSKMRSDHQRKSREIAKREAEAAAARDRKLVLAAKTNQAAKLVMKSMNTTPEKVVPPPPVADSLTKSATYKYKYKYCHCEQSRPKQQRNKSYDFDLLQRVLAQYGIADANISVDGKNVTIELFKSKYESEADTRGPAQLSDAAVIPQNVELVKPIASKPVSQNRSPPVRRSTEPKPVETASRPIETASKPEISIVVTPPTAPLVSKPPSSTEPKPSAFTKQVGKVAAKPQSGSPTSSTVKIDPKPAAVVAPANKSTNVPSPTTSKVTSKPPAKEASSSSSAPSLSSSPSTSTSLSSPSQIQAKNPAQKQLTASNSNVSSKPADDPEPVQEKIPSIDRTVFAAELKALEISLAPTPNKPALEEHDVHNPLSFYELRDFMSGHLNRKSMSIGSSGGDANQAEKSIDTIEKPTEVTPLTHATRSRPQVKGRKPPSKANIKKSSDAIPVETYELPTELVLAGDYLRLHKRIQKEGLFRVAGREADAENAIYKGMLHNFDDSHAMASYVKKFFKQSEKVLAGLSEQDVNAISKNLPNANEVLNEKLSAKQNTLFRYAISLLADVARHSDRNKMDAKNLATIFAPLLYEVSLQGVVNPQSVIDQNNKVVTIVQHLISNEIR